MPQSTDFCIVGGGLVGALMALLLAQRNYTVTLVERQKAPPPQKLAPLDTRALALNYGTIQLLKNWNFGDLLDKIQWISKIHVSDQGHCGIVHIHAQDEKLPYLGGVIPFEELVFSLQQKALSHPKIKFMEHMEGINAKITIGADGADSSVRKMLGIQAQEYDYDAFALIGKIRVKKAITDYAFERFTKEGPIALLPAGTCLYTLVWVRHDATPPSNLVSALQQAFGYRAGIFVEHGVMKSYPLKRVLAEETYRDSVGLLGNAAHSLHPVAGQGFNLAARDILTFLEVLDMHAALDVSLWQEYSKRSAFQQKMIQRLNHTFVKGFEGHNPLLRMARNVLLSLFEVSSFARTELNDVMIGKY